MRTKPLYEETPDTRIAGARRDIRQLKRRLYRPGPWQYATPLAPAPDPSDLSDSAEGAAFKNGWANIALPDGSYSPLRWRFSHDGRVQLTGAIDGGALDTVCVTLPSAYRPVEDVIAAVSSVDGGRVMTIKIDASTGDVTVIGIPGASSIIGDGQVDTGAIADGAVTTAKLANGAVTTVKIADGAVTGAKLEDDGVTPGTYGDATHIPVITVDAKGRVTAASEDAISGASGVTEVTDGTHTVNPASELDFTADLVVTDAGGGVADVALSNTGVGAGSYGDASHVAQVTVDAKGRITAAVSTAIQIAEAAVTGLVADLAAKLSASLLTAKGALITATAASTAATLAVGADGDVLTADSTQSTGLKWVPPSGVSLSLPWVNVKDHGAVGDVTTVGTGGTDDTAAFVAAIAALPTINGHPAGVILVPAGIYRINGDIGNIGPYVSIIGEGKWASILDYRGTGDCIRVADLSGAPAAPGWLNGKYAGALRHFAIDGTSAGSASTGLHYGDINGGEIDILVQNFTGATAQAILFENTLWWTERVRCKAILRNNTFAVTYQISASGAATATGSFGHGDYDFQIYGLADQRAVRVLAGAHVYDGSLRIDGATTKGTLSSLGVLAVSGTGPAGTGGAGGYSQVYNMHLDVTVEHQADVAHGGTTLQQTIHLGDVTNNLVQDCYGQLSFLNYDVSNVDLSTGAFRFTGVISGDSTLGKAAFTKLFDKTLGGDAANIDTGAIIPAGYSALMVVLYARMSDASNAVNVGLRFNGDAGSNYGHVWTRDNGVTVSGGDGSTDSSAVVGALPAGSSAANVFGTARATIPSYDQTTNYKSVEAHAVAVDTTATNSFDTSSGCFWKSTAAITRITAIDVPGNNFKAGSRMIVYGLP